MAIHSDSRLRLPHRILVATAAGLLVAFSTGTALLTRGQAVARLKTVIDGDSRGATQGAGHGELAAAYLEAFPWSPRRRTQRNTGRRS